MQNILHLNEKIIFEMKILILGGNGMVGHMLIKQLSKKFEVFSTLRNKNKFDSINFFENFLNKENCFFIDDINESEALEKIIDRLSPDIVINCIGVIKQREESQDLINMIKVNSLFPHILNTICYSKKIKLIHISTDCVFSGEKGNYSDSDYPTPIDRYGETKLLGEIKSNNALTIRTSFIGPEILNKKSLFEWIMSQKNSEIDGYTNAIYTGLTTLEFSKILINIIDNYLYLEGVWQISSSQISKFQLIKMINKKFELNIRINPNDSFKCNRSLDSMRFKEETTIKVSSWETMIEDLYNEIKEKN